MGLLRLALSTALLAAAYLVSRVYSQQVTLTAPSAGPYIHSHGQTTSSQPLRDLSLLSSVDYTNLRHGAFPNYNVRIKKSDFCDGTVAYALLPFLAVLR